MVIAKKALLESWLDCWKKDLDELGLMIISKKDYRRLKAIAITSGKYEKKLKKPS